MPNPGQERACSAIYFHGVPGSPRELELFGPMCRLSQAWAPDRNNDCPDLGYEDYFDDLAERVAARAAQEGLHLVGFSLGAVAALQVAHRLGTKVTRIDLISAAAPLELGSFLPVMEGQTVFEAARRRPKLFGALTSAQALLSRLSPGLLARMLLASAQGADQVLARDPSFRAALGGILGTAFAHGATGYRREILGYVQPWSAILPKISAPVTLWHGTADNWSPIAMADGLHAALPNARPVVRFEGLSHYSTLHAALEQIVGNRS